MAKIIRFPLKMRDNYEARTIEELREHFDLSTVLSYYSSGKLTKWLENGYYDDEAKKVAELTPSSDGLGKQICDIFGVTYSEDTSVDVGAIFKKTDKLVHLKKFTSDDSIIAAVDRVAFTQADLDALLKNGIEEIYLCDNHFTIPANVPSVTYIGVNMPSADFEGDIFEKGIHIKGIKFDINKYLENNYDILNVDKESIYNFSDFFSSDLKATTDSLTIVSEKAQCFIGVCYMAENDYNEAIDWLRKSAEQNFADAQYLLGFCYQCGWGVKHDYQEAVKWYCLSSEQGNIDALYYLGDCYYHGYGVTQSYCEAVKRYSVSAEKGHAEAQNSLGKCYYYGLGVEMDSNEAEKWFRLAAKHGNTDARRFLDEHYS